MAALSALMATSIREKRATPFHGGDLDPESRSDGFTEALIRLADWHYIMEKGRIVWSGDSAALSAAPDLRERYLGV